MVFIKVIENNRAHLILREFVDGGLLEITHVLSLPRTMSTIYERGLAEADYAHGQINEPFLRQKVRSFRQGTHDVLARARHLMEQTNERPVKLIIKDIANSFTDEEWQTWMPLVQNFSVIVRDPFMQMESLMRFSGKRITKQSINLVPMLQALGQFAISRDGIDAGTILLQTILYIQDVLEHVGIRNIEELSQKDDLKWAMRFVGKYVESFSWLSVKMLQRHMAAIESHIRHHNGSITTEATYKRYAIITGMHLKSDHSLLSDVAESLGLGRVSDCDWHGDFYDARALGKQTSWHDKARESRGLESCGVGDIPKTLDWFPEHIQRHIVEVTLPFYIDVIKNAHFVAPSLQTIRHIAVYNPIDAYVLATHGFRGEDRRAVKILADQLLVKHPEFAASFKYIAALPTCGVSDNSAIIRDDL